MHTMYMYMHLENSLLIAWLSYTFMPGISLKSDQACLEEEAFQLIRDAHIGTS